MQRIFEKAALALALVAMPLWTGVACAQQPLRMMVGFPPGGTTDVIARLVAQRLGGELSRSVVVENRAGASGNLAAATVAKADPDGNTLLFAPSSHATNASLYTNQSFDTVKSFRAVGMVAVTPYVLVVNPDMQATNLRDFVDYLKRNPGKVEFASASPGTGQHLAAELFKDEAGVDIMHVPYKGSAAALPDLIAGRVPMMFDNIAVMLPHIQQGTVRPLAITSKTRSRFLPDTPTMAESGYPDFEVLGWFTLLAPAKTPDATVQAYNDALKKISADPDFVAQLAKLGGEAVARTPAQADAYIAEEVDKWGKVIRTAHINLN
ncbi:putative lipoprotein [Bordetella bronchiseptica MO149]|uniref:tripartite tricarboxylate transporter substrate binding protein n=1 Tax=Bordetella bronchiseptica TaxID=518 RepID=UPI00028B1078|nr:tripartite tricarboxylate transporter substrate binding protein [Bordetella bronchiseptica]QIY01682.1 tripartite tricarboxylate transporter substrate binding protein [Bordetella bronchiseptica]CCJ57639.1 putative lipoprotein [Bordetella bronchiseptica MO149]